MTATAPENGPRRRSVLVTAAAWTIYKLCSHGIRAEFT